MSRLAASDIAAAACAESETIAGAMARLADLVGDARVWSHEARRALLQHLDRAVDGLTAVRAAVLVAERESGDWRGAGDRSFEAWRHRTGRTGQRSAAAQVRQAEQLGAVPAAAAAAVTAGRIGLEHAAVIGKVAIGGTAAQRDAVLSAAGQDHLLGMAERLDAGTFAAAVDRWTATVDPAALERDHEAQRAERFLHVATSRGGTFIKGRLDSMAGHRLTLALEALSPRPAADDDRDPGQRRADALDAMASGILTLADTKPGAHVPPQVSVILSAETWAAARAERDHRRRAPQWSARDGDAAGWSRSGNADISRSAQPTADADTVEHAPGAADSSSVAYAPATLEDGTPVPAAELAALMCDCEITRIVIDAAGVPVDLGRAERVFTGQQRRAVIARDRRCAWPDCGAHARWCEVHHIRWWERDVGSTSLDNGVLLCSFHHHEVHRRDLSITRVGVQVLDLSSSRTGGSEPGRSPSAFAPMGYKFTDPRGRVLGESPPTRSAAMGPVAAGPVAVGPVAVGPVAAEPVAVGGHEPARGTAPVDDGVSLPGSRGTVPTRSGPPGGDAVVCSLGTDREVSDAPAGQAVAGMVDDFDMTWTTDPVTGVRVPAFFLSG